ncbi:outer membrane transport energization protein TonB [Azospirillum baldaniorum]|uniref:energy transducer TonB n=1 Tax=Azospirillum baldaniorum TaxID=1064539 RepID=UPI00119D89B0|nr:energy transducer TonB [Azospirillum baldaniorum]TWA58536.1 outer membrane transport energization protein TonB [Azospirillum baldaniorum]
MSVATFDPNDLPDGEERTAPALARWGGSLVVVLGAHALLALAALSWHVAMEEAPAAPPAVMLDLPPMPETPAAEPPPTLESMLPEPELPPEPVIEPEPEPEPIPEIAPEPPPPVPAEVALPEPPPKPKPKPKEEPKPKPKAEPPKPRPQTPPKAVTEAPANAAPAAAPPASAPAQAAPVMRNSNALPTWHGAVLGHLERYKRYPRIAQMRRQQGVPQVHITLDRQGRVLAVRLHKGSGFEALDEETIALVERASPLPAPPPDVAQDRMELVVPVQYFLR